jgi:hypothetical protein
VVQKSVASLVKYTLNYVLETSVLLEEPGGAVGVATGYGLDD